MAVVASAVWRWEGARQAAGGWVNALQPLRMLHSCWYMPPCSTHKHATHAPLPHQKGSARCFFSANSSPPKLSSMMAAVSPP